MKKLIFGILFFSIIGGNLIVAEASSQDWLQYRFNSENNPVINNEKIDDYVQKIDTNNEIRSTPVVVGERVFIGNHDSGEIYAYNLETGELLWENQAENWIHSEIIYVNDQLFVGYGNRFIQENGNRGTEKSGLLSLDPSTGEILWDFTTDGEVMPTPAFYKGVVYIATGDRQLYGINAKSGEEEWSLKLGSIVSMSSPNIKDGILYVGGAFPFKFFAVDLDNKEIIWEKQLDELDYGLDDVPPVVSEKGLVYTTGVKATSEKVSIREVYDSDGVIEAYKQAIKKYFGKLINKQAEVKYEHYIYAFNSENGETIWKKSLGKGQLVPNNKSGAPILYKGKVFVGSPITKTYYAYNSKDGEMLWSYESNVNKAPPVAKNEVVYFTDTKGIIYAFDTNTGDLLGSKKVGGTLAPSGPLIVNDQLIVGSQDSILYTLPTKDIIESSEEIKGNSLGQNNLFSYLFFIYILPILLVVSGVAIIIFSVKKISRS